MDGVTVIQKRPIVNIEKTKVVEIQTVQRIVQVTTIQSLSVLKTIPFYFVATSGQTDFTLPTTPKTGGLIMLARGGTWQSQAKTPPDFTVNGKVITMSPQDEGDELAGIYEAT